MFQNDLNFFFFLLWEFFAFYFLFVKKTAHKDWFVWTFLFISADGNFPTFLKMCAIV